MTGFPSLLLRSVKGFSLVLGNRCSGANVRSGHPGVAVTLSGPNCAVRKKFGFHLSDLPFFGLVAEVMISVYVCVCVSVHIVFCRRALETRQQ